MCIIAHSPKGVALPSIKYRKNMFDHNDDGAGFAFVKDKVVHWEKGFMSFAEFEEALERVSSSIDTKEVDFVMHFRIGTHGGNTPQNTHPFIVSRDYNDMKRLNGKTREMVVFHNGIINSVNAYNGVSDTMTWIHDRLYFLYNYDKNCIKNPLITDMITLDINNSKLAFVSTRGVYRIGSWMEGDDGNFYSNSTYSYPAVTYSNKYLYTPSTYSYTGGVYNTYTEDDDSNLPWSIPKTSKITYYKINKERRDEVFIETQADIYDIADISQDIYVSFTSDNKLVGDKETHVESNCKIVDKDLKELSTTDLSRKGMIHWKDNITEFKTENYRVKYVSLDEEKDEMWDLEKKSIYYVKGTKAIITEDEEIFVKETDGKYHFVDLVPATKDKNGVFRVTSYEDLMKVRKVDEVDEFFLHYT